MTQPHADYDTIVVGGGPSGATAAHELANKGHRVLLLERGFRIKPCGGAIPPCLLQEFTIPDHSGRCANPFSAHDFAQRPVGGYADRWHVCRHGRSR